ncbi:hypothetical protein ACFE04_025169 [Oxalis oulophora]
MSTLSKANKVHRSLRVNSGEPLDKERRTKKVTEVGFGDESSPLPKNIFIMKIRKLKRHVAAKLEKKVRPSFVNDVAAILFSLDLLSPKILVVEVVEEVKVDKVFWRHVELAICQNFSSLSIQSESV